MSNESFSKKLSEKVSSKKKRSFLTVQGFLRLHFKEILKSKETLTWEEISSLLSSEGIKWKNGSPVTSSQIRSIISRLKNEFLILSQKQKTIDSFGRLISQKSLQSSQYRFTKESSNEDFSDNHSYSKKENFENSSTSFLDDNKPFSNIKDSSQKDKTLKSANMQNSVNSENSENSQISLNSEIPKKQSIDRKKILLEMERSRKERRS